MTRYRIDSCVYARAFRELAFGRELQEFHRVHLSRLVMSAVVASEVLVGASTAAHERGVQRALIEPFRVRRRLLTPTWSAWDLASKIDRRLRAVAANRTKLAQRSFFQDILIAASAREFGVTIITENRADFTENRADFALITRHVDIAFTSPWPVVPAA